MTVVRCQTGCTCGRHRSPKCQPGCTCYKHHNKVFTGEQNYFDYHIQVREIRGSAENQSCVECENQAKHWATIHGRTGEDPYQDFQPMCVKCHHAYDKIHERAGFHGKKHSEETKAKMSQTRKGKSWLDDATSDQREAFKKAVSEGTKGRIPLECGQKDRSNPLE